jgi:hypothetical protein
MSVWTGFIHSYLIAGKGEGPVQISCEHVNYNLRPQKRPELS